MGMTCSGSECNCGAEGDDVLRRELLPQLGAKFVVDDVNCSRMLRVLRVRPSVKVVWVDGPVKDAAVDDCTFNPTALITARQSSDATLVANTCLASVECQQRHSAGRDLIRPHSIRATVMGPVLHANGVALFYKVQLHQAAGRRATGERPKSAGHRVRAARVAMQGTTAQQPVP
ncbi:MAG: hypothetical protein KVP17_002732 [Porospora cf. gigantea B]|uniref:uncharacterized protein n=1 Tax=Porospora cf. gigantea B TaxID=2853592 RepID=UPI003571AC0B|nr:MAG: hypothetical protein KVP17_002732 [Porospora cf. gigantea B]